MVPGPDLVVACPHCKKLAKYMTLRSGNTMGTRVWTDGKQIAPMLPHPPAIVKCRRCEEYYWLADAEEVGTLERKSQKVNPSWVAAEYVEEPTEEEYYLALQKNFAKDREQEITLRVLAWWRRNDTFRDVPEERSGIINAVLGVHRDNLDKLACLLDETDENDLIMKAEVFRELGKFKAAKEVLHRVTSSQYSSVVRQLCALCDSNDTCVRELQFSA